MVALDSAPWVEKYRPDTLDDVAAHKEIISTSTYIYIYMCVCVCLCMCLWKKFMCHYETLWALCGA